MDPIKTPGTCKGVEKTLSVIGGKWKPLILFHLRNGAVRHGALQKAIPQITQKMLTQQLRQLEVDGLVTREVFAIVPPKVEYNLSKSAHSLLPILAQMAQWGATH